MTEDRKQKRIRIKGIVGLGFDDEDGHTRMTHGDNFSVHDGSEITHEQLQEICLKINRLLDEEGEPPPIK